MLESISVFGADKQNWTMAILASSILVGPPAEATGLLSPKMIPSHISMSSMVPPIFSTILMLVRSTFLSTSGLQTFRTASTANGARLEEFWETTLLDRLVVTHWMSCSLLFRSIGVA